MPGVFRRVVRWWVRGAVRRFAGAVGVAEDMMRSFGSAACFFSCSPKISDNFCNAATWRAGIVFSSPMRREIAAVRVRARRRTSSG